MLKYNLLYINTELLTIVLFIFCDCYIKGRRQLVSALAIFDSLILCLTPKLSRDTSRRVAYEDFFGWNSDILAENMA